jgi:SAM-dependent methyltransferase
VAESDGQEQDLQALLAEQLAYYRARAPEYSETAIPDVTEHELLTAEAELSEAVRRFGLGGDVLELACGPGTWTRLLLQGATSVTAVDGAPEMLALAEEKLADRRVRLIHADLFEWSPDRRYDGVFFGFWLSHVPLERFEAFWETVGRALKPSGRVLFVDDAYRTADELIEGDRSAIIRRALNDGRTYRAIKVPHTPKDLEKRLGRLGWSIRVKPTAGPFYWGSGTRG